MFGRLIAQLIVALFQFFGKQVEESKKAVDADVDRDSLNRASDRITDWVRNKDSAGTGGQPNSGGSKLQK